MMPESITAEELLEYLSGMQDDEILIITFMEDMHGE